MYIAVMLEDDLIDEFSVNEDGEFFPIGESSPYYKRDYAIGWMGEALTIVNFSKKMSFTGMFYYDVPTLYQDREHVNAIIETTE